jgi:hypothetical protein
MQKLSNRMEKGLNQREDAPKEPEMAAKQAESEAEKTEEPVPRGFPCRYCGSRNTMVYRTLPSMKRERKCNSCHRRFFTIERATLV